jgi:hypothetical protein
MTVEERISRALREQAENLDVDVARLHAATLRATRHGVRRPRRGVLVLVCAAVVAVLAAGMLGTALLVDDSRTPVLSNPAPDRTSVAKAFACPRQITVDDAGRRRDDSFLPSLRGGPEAAARQEGAPRYRYSEAGRTATLRLGNADGSLASVSTFRRTDDGWDLVTTTKCAAADGGVQVPSAGTDQLGRHESKAYPPDQMIDSPDQAVLIDDRSSYDVAGLVRHRSLWVSPCGDRLCLTSGSPTAMLVSKVAFDARPRDVSSMLVDPDDSEGRPKPWGLWILADPGRTVLAVRATTKDGRSIDAIRQRGPGWTGQVYAVLARKAAVDTITVRTVEGSRAYPEGDID